MGTIWRSTRRFIYGRILRADDTPHRIALGVAIATFVAFTPTMGVQTLIALGLAALIGANKAVCVPIVWITNPFTFVPIYWSCWRLGAAITPNAGVTDEVAVISKLQGYSEGGLGFATSLFSYEFWAGMVQLMFELGTELWLGSILVGTVCGTGVYFLTRWVVIAYRSRRQQRMMRSLAKRGGAAGNSAESVVAARKSA